jgi:2-iminobutanoate/2-iminopropanoate deaminase
MQKRTIKTEKAPAPGGAYSQAIVAGNFVFTAGMVGVDPKTGEAPKGIAAQTRQTLLNLKATLEAAGTSLENVVRANAYLRSISDFKEYNTAYQEFFVRDPPARTTVEAALAKDYLVEINVIAVIPDKAPS